MVSEKRTKLDCFLGMENENSQCMNKAAGTNWQTQGESLSSDSSYNLRKTMAWDSAFFTSPGVLDPEELFATLNFAEKKSSPLDSSDIENISTIGGSNARRSLAWDSAFFTSAGVLDQEELSLVNRGFNKCESHHLPGIKEVWRSADSNSTIDSDDFSLSSLEIDIFGDLRASMHQARKVSESSILGSKLGRTAPKLSQTSSQVRVKPMQPSRRQGIRTHGLDISKEAPLPPRGRTKLGTQTGESNMLRSLRSPKVIGRTTSPLTTSTSRPYFSANQLKMETKAKKDSAGECMSSTVFPKSPSMVSPTATNNYAVFTSPSPNSNDKAQSNTMRKVNSRLAVSSSNSRTPLSYARNRSGLVSSSLPNHVLSTPKSSSSISPAASRDGWSSESSSSVKRKSVDSSARLDTIPCGLLHFDNDSSQLLDSAYHRGTRSPRNAKPSCLRKPSPKIGFFDEEQYTALELKGYRNFHPSIRSSRTENGTSNLNGECSKTRFGKQQLSGSSVGNMKPGSWQSGVLCPSVIRTAHGADSAFRVLSSRDCLKPHGVGATCDVERKGTLASRKRNKTSKQSSKEPEEARDSDKENIVPLENLVEDLSRHIQAIDLRQGFG
ncbi:uncharacterized protein LOC119989704 isoform X2 [Tripterygium wilfordii]|uniref:uncharacterized protein LOC119989704 isoform X2 n=1 Tax=Tripterygium wilfordii TaxID=458696 RepID=UPI0018F84F4F|nr:uncharacterized protein LOC119989704 isoform X2 [Tripterygium wilfordii]